MKIKKPSVHFIEIFLIEHKFKTPDVLNPFCDKMKLKFFLLPCDDISLQQMQQNIKLRGLRAKHNREVNPLMPVVH